MGETAKNLQNCTFFWDSAIQKESISLDLHPGGDKNVKLWPVSHVNSEIYIVYMSYGWKNAIGHINNSKIDKRRSLPSSITCYTGQSPTTPPPQSSQDLGLDTVTPTTE
ncbi:hypothetical protein SAY87_012269 [Trapa incisa]|uniref:Uncharacterized protein n=1 Tax=Trapa incisa TaxID=236973 RepID=A0AAN7JJC9_9MYRT|nr:hypothetical protein SAY87_012269 [Trapa incisa]